MRSIVAEHQPETQPAGLTEHQVAVLDFERSWWQHPGAKETAIRERFDRSATRHYAELNRLIDNPLAMAADPLLVKRLLRLRDARRAQRSAARLGFDGA